MQSHIIKKVYNSLFWYYIGDLFMVAFEALHNKICIQKFESNIERHCRLFCNVISTTTNQYHEGHIKCLLWFQQLKAWTVNFQDISPLLLYCYTTIISFSWPPTNTLNGLTCTFPSHPLNSICGGFSIPLWIFFPSLGHVKKSTAIKHYSTANFRVMFSLSSRRAKPAECSSTAQNGCQQQAKQLKDIHEPWIFLSFSKHSHLKNKPQIKMQSILYILLSWERNTSICTLLITLQKSKLFEQFRYIICNTLPSDIYPKFCWGYLINSLCAVFSLNRL